MFIYNTTYLVSDARYGVWMKWLEEEHIPAMLKSVFQSPQVAKVLTADPEQEGTSVSVQFAVLSLEMLSEWSESSGDSLQQELFDRFGNEVLSFSTVLEVL